MDTEDLIEKKVKIMILLYIMIIMLAMLPCMINQVIKICSYKQTTSLNVDDKYYQNYLSLRKHSHHKYIYSY